MRKCPNLFLLSGGPMDGQSMPCEVLNISDLFFAHPIGDVWGDCPESDRDAHLHRYSRSGSEAMESGYMRFFYCYVDSVDINTGDLRKIDRVGVE